MDEAAQCSAREEIRTLAAVSPVYKEVAESMATSNIEPAEVSMARYHDRYVSGMRGSYAAGWDARQEEVNAITEERDAIAEERDTIAEERDVIAEMYENAQQRIAELEKQLQERKE